MHIHEKEKKYKYKETGFLNVVFWSRVSKNSGDGESLKYEVLYS